MNLGNEEYELDVQPIAWPETIPHTEEPMTEPERLPLEDPVKQ